MSEWSSFYASRVCNEGYITYARERYAEHLYTVNRAIRPGDHVLEVGFGLGTITKILARDEQMPVLFRGYERDPEMLDLSMTNNPDMRSRIHEWDMLHPYRHYANVVHGHGVLEHLSDAEIRKAIDVARRSGARCLIHYVPGAKYVTPSFGDERLLTANQWREIAKPHVSMPKLAEALTKLVGTSAYSMAPHGRPSENSTKEWMLGSTVSDYRNAALEALKRESPAVMAALSKRKTDIFNAAAAGKKNARVEGARAGVDNLNNLLSAYGVSMPKPNSVKEP